MLQLACAGEQLEWSEALGVRGEQGGGGLARGGGGKGVAARVSKAALQVRAVASCWWGASAGGGSWLQKPEMRACGRPCLVESGAGLPAAGVAVARSWAAGGWRAKACGCVLQVDVAGGGSDGGVRLGPAALTRGNQSGGGRWGAVGQMRATG
nr:uncharacterized protein LOC127339675 [Lolium perenne]